MRAAVAAANQLGATATVVAVPIGAPATCRMLRADADDVVCPWQPEGFGSVGAGYRRFDQVDDAEVLDLLGR
jgi:predicted phosphoribosyltransferase